MNNINALVKQGRFSEYDILFVCPESVLVSFYSSEEYEIQGPGRIGKCRYQSFAPLLSGERYAGYDSTELYGS